MKKSIALACIGMITGALALQAAPEIIYAQPDGEQRIYTRQGSTLQEAEDGGDYTVAEQEGTISLVFADDGAVYLQDPVSGYTMSGTWVRGTLSADGQTITVPLGQYVDYTRSFDMAYQMQLLRYDTEAETYVVDSLATEVTYSVGDEAIMLCGTSRESILGLVIRTFGNPQGSAIGQDFAYLNGEWLGFGDFDSRYEPAQFQPAMPPEGLAAEHYYLTTARYDGASYAPYSETVQMALDERQATVWVQGITHLLPAAWAKGTLHGSTVTLATGQFLGTIEGIPLYLHGASLDSDGNFTIKDIEMTLADGHYVTYDYVFITTSATSLKYVTFYMGATFAPQPDTTIDTPVSLDAWDYNLTYQEQATGARRTSTVQAGAYKNVVFYVRGVCPYLPEAWVVGAIDGDQVVFTLPQYLGTYNDGGQAYPLYFTAFDSQTGAVEGQLTFSYDPETQSLSNPSAPACISINKTGYLSVQDYYNMALTNTQPSAIGDIAHPAAPQRYFDLQGRAVSHPASGIYLDADGHKVVLHGAK